ncbi:DeoR family lactose phosphotransferase system repressor [Clostridium acetobutylicum]|uniref:Lactose phosphotransferase system repressor n=1 Tax=Clostridium acetobutylicum (strain ATCC 824 / DSM 792 / JCM 1419 / IAM 19013 / LMG 5710 / NBRC 13948 / NRRL B-527 / VKM B-1787 / 2291 / W) TaxID=272562 RepID=Q97F00_CLOAB|nr:MULTISPECIES: DeoR/GlpR family DNA-binding transcription regulator [Clostridium]AAK80897.1 Lactose phosphotransferase system repressor lacR [Clostridium acetobutylicum ATCC 824]ADZ21999.1 Lactose phosphotransferase system repressor [Clostridium acetobutylicum EA 2018]AEI34601.1 lactose phosphotransferase system repressor lacR [Clostridium acetobutylicum DSM 1731]AWV78691.1 DeoR/GlpR transcriptional regulator [Clostridium acetobutylicum]KHD37258.1 DeoR faimly transcriptional regulator [Clost
MLKEERFQRILEMLETNNIIKITDINEKLGVTEITVRRDLKVLENKGLIERIYGGAKKVNANNKVEFKELSNNEKRKINIEQKRHIAKLASEMIEENDIIYIGPGTTSELIYDYLNVSYVKVITNSMSVFLKFKDDKRYEIILVGGHYRSHTDVFVGSFTNENLRSMRVKTAFVGTNGIYNDNITTSNEEEGMCQKIIMDNAAKKYVLCDSSKVGKEDFFSFYSLEDVTGIITDKNIDEGLKKQYQNRAKIICS